MNSSRYLRIFDLGRVSLLIETGLQDALLEQRKDGNKDWNVAVSASQVQYRQSVELDDRFQIRICVTSRWDDNAFYLEQLVLDKKQRISFFLFGL